MNAPYRLLGNRVGLVGQPGSDGHLAGPSAFTDLLQADGVLAGIATAYHTEGEIGDAIVLLIEASKEPVCVSCTRPCLLALSGHEVLSCRLLMFLLVHPHLMQAHFLRCLVKWCSLLAILGPFPPRLALVTRAIASVGKCPASPLAATPSEERQACLASL